MEWAYPKGPASTLISCVGKMGAAPSWGIVQMAYKLKLDQTSKTIMLNVINIFSRKLPEGFYRVKTPDELLAPHAKKIAEMYRLAGVQRSVFDRYYQPALDRLAAFAQATPASENHHHAYAGGLLEHSLQTIQFALKARKSHILPAGEGPEVTTRVSDLYTYCVFCAAILHDIAKPATDQRITLYANTRDVIGEWSPFSVNMLESGAKFYTVAYRRDRQYRLHEMASLMFTRIIPDCGMDWLRSEPQVFNELMITASNLDEVSVVKEIVKKGDQASVSLNLGAQTLPSFSNTKPLHEKVITALRKLAADGQITFNRKGANTFVQNGTCWAMAKTLPDLVRKQLQDEGHTGIPGGNPRLFDVMAEHNIIQSNKGDKAVWKIQVTLDDWKPDPFTMLCLPVSILFTSEDAVPADFQGKIQIIAEADSEPKESDTETDNSATSDKPATEPAGADVPATEDSSPLINLFLDDEVIDVPAKPAKPAKIEPVTVGKSTPTKSSAASNQDEEKKPIEPVTVGNSFKEWLESGLNHNTLKINTSDAMVHILKEGIFLVSPVIFREYGKQSGANWQDAQREFQRERLQLKNEDEENWFEVRIQGRKGYSNLKGWLVPPDRLKIDPKKLKEPNSHLKLITKRMEL